MIAANIDYLLIVAAVKQPPFRHNLINRMLVAASVGNITPILVLTKTDLSNRQEIEELIAPYQGLDLEIIPFSINDELPNPRLKEILTGNISVLSGQSGVGKSSLLNKLFPFLSIKVSAISTKTDKGSHTTTYAIMHEIENNSFVIDTPGIREFGLWDVSQESLGAFFPEVKRFHNLCKHRNCSHIHEPQCAVKEAVANHQFHRVLYDGYVAIFESLRKR